MLYLLLQFVYPNRADAHVHEYPEDSIVEGFAIVLVDFVFLSIFTTLDIELHLNNIIHL